MSRKQIRIACKGATSVPWDQLIHFQGDLKDLSEESYAKLRKEIIETGFAFAPHVWFDQKKKKAYLIAGHQRLRCIKQMVEKEGFTCPKIPVALVEAKNLKEAKRRVLQEVAEYGNMTGQGLYNFMETGGLKWDDVKGSFRFAEVNLDKFGAEYFKDSTPTTEEEKTGTAGTASTFDDVPKINAKKARLIQGDCLEQLKKLKPNSVDALVCDPPAGISFMGAAWDTDKGGRDKWIAWMRDVMKECLRVLKPGAHGAVWAIPRTSHWTAMAVEDAGFIVRDVVTHLFGQGFAKSHNISKAIDEAAGAERKVIGSWKPTGTARPNKTGSHSCAKTTAADANYDPDNNATVDITAPATPEAIQWDGWGTGLKPASEHWILIRKPCSEKTVAKNVLKWGTGGININGCRIGTDGRPLIEKTGQQNNSKWPGGGGVSGMTTGSTRQGRFPANLVLSHTPQCERVGMKKVKGSNAGLKDSERQNEGGSFGGGVHAQGNDHVNTDGTETVEDWRCAPDCPVRMLDEQSGDRKSGGVPSSRRGMGYHGGLGNESTEGVSPSEGGASRFFYCAKPSKSERNEGCEGLPTKSGVLQGRAGLEGKKRYDGGKAPAKGTWESHNYHPTVKPVSLMRYLCRLVTPPKGTVLDPFMGSGSTGLAALREKLRFIGIEKESEYMEIARRRIAANQEEIVEPKKPRRKKRKARPKKKARKS